MQQEFYEIMRLPDSVSAFFFFKQSYILQKIVWSGIVLHPLENITGGGVSMCVCNNK